MECKVQQDSSSLEYDKIVSRVVDEDWDSAIRVQLDEPRLLLTLCSPDVNVLETDKVSESFASLSGRLLTHNRLQSHRLL